jgi:hypothetical protein
MTELHKIKSASMARENFTTHGMSKTKEYRAWKTMRSRCLDPNNISFKNYGGRGICFSPEWESFQAFYLSLGPKPSPDHTLERRDNASGYSPENCYWATRTEQVRNRRNSILVTLDGLTLSLQEWAEKTGISFGTLWWRLKVKGSSVHDALTTPLRRQNVSHS